MRETITVDEQFSILEQIGEGTESILWRAQDWASRRWVAIKELNERLRQDPRALEQFHQKGQFFAGLEQDNFVKVYAVVQPKGWIVMELMRGSLAQKLTHGPLVANLVRSILRQVLEALVYLHDHRDVIHGQLCPSKILINDLGRVKLGVFAGVPVGSEFRPPRNPKYVAPELLDHRRFGAVGKPVDLYCLGFIALELLKGPGFDSLFRGVGINPDVDWMRWHRSTDEALPPCREIVPGVPQDVAQVVDRLVQKSVTDRFPSAQSALEALERAPILPVETSEMLTSQALPRRAPPIVDQIVHNKWEGFSLGVRNSSYPGDGPASSPVKPFLRGPQPLEPIVKETRRSLKERLNAIVEKPYVLYPLLALIVLATLCFVLYSPTPKRNVILQVEPADAKVTVDKAEVKVGTEIRLELGKHKVVAEKDGYQKYEKTHEIAKGDDAVTIAIELEKIPEAFMADVADVKGEPAASKLVLVVDPPSARAKIWNKIYQVQDPDHGTMIIPLDDMPLKSATVEVLVEAEDHAQQLLQVDRQTAINSEQVPKEVLLNPIVKFTPTEVTVQLGTSPARKLSDGGLELDRSQSSFVILAKAEGYEDFKKELTLQEVRDMGYRIKLSKREYPIEDIASRLGYYLLESGRFGSRKLDSAKVPLEFVRVDPGPFTFGVPHDRQEKGELSEEQRTIKIPYLISVTEVTNRHYAAFVAEKANAVVTEAWKRHLPSDGSEADHPVVWVSLEHAREFCKWLGGRLPTEEEWERAARGREGRLYPWTTGGADIDALNTKCRLWSPQGERGTVAVTEMLGSATPEGLLHTLGNVAEWCDDVYRAGCAEDGSEPGVARWNVVRGGSFMDPPQRARLTMRGNCEPAGAAYVGFRVVIPLQ